jgi:hypothetical protein
MSIFYLEVFQQTEDLVRLRLFDARHDLEDERDLEQELLFKLLEDSEEFYKTGRGNRAELGEALYRWLDGPSAGWLSNISRSREPISLYITVDHKLRHIPWELLLKHGEFLCTHAVHPLIPVRTVNFHFKEQVPKNRPLRVLFMAASALDVRPILAFELEEATILRETRKAGVELVVEESGTLEGLQEWVDRFPEGEIDVVHMSGHAEIQNNAPVFLSEDSKGYAKPVEAEDIAKVFSSSGRFPRLLFLSGCRTGQALGQGAVPSLCEALVASGVPAVLGWALPVGDQTATLAAAELYERLGHGVELDRAAAHVRQFLYSRESPYWSLLRLYAANPLSALVTPTGYANRARLRQVDTRQRFLDARGKVEVCPRERFVGRRREIQLALRVLTALPGDDDYAEGVLLHGLGGLGKSSLAARLCDRLSPTHRPWVWVGRLDETSLRQVINEQLAAREGLRQLNERRLSLGPWLHEILTGFLDQYSVIFVFDDFEQNLESSGAGVEWQNLEAQKCVQELLAALHRSGSASRVVVTCRYEFPLREKRWLRVISIPSLREGDQGKIVQTLPNLSPNSGTTEDVRERAIDLAAGNPRLLVRMDKALGVPNLDHLGLLIHLREIREEFREEILLRKIIDTLDIPSRKLLAALALHKLPFPEPVLQNHLDGSIDESMFGLIPAFEFPAYGLEPPPMDWLQNLDDLPDVDERSDAIDNPSKTGPSEKLNDAIMSAFSGLGRLLKKFQR